MPPSLGSEPPIHVHTPDDEPEEGLGDINQHTDGAEFYGRTGTFYFLSRLQSRAKGQKEQRPELATTSRHRSSFHQPRDTIRSDESVVNLLHSSDYPVSTAQNARVISQSQASQSPQQPLLPDTAGSASFSAPSPGGAVRGSAARTELERQCARLYFTNLHCIHPILDQQAFLNRCEKEVWAKDVVTAPPETLTPGATGARSRSRFLSLFNIVLAIGAITAEDTALVMWEGAAEFLDQAFRQDGKCDNESTYIPIKASQVFFETAKFHLEDTFESCSFETAQTLFLMSSPGPSTYLINCMVDLAEILMDISANAARLDEPETLLQRSSRAFVLDQRLSAWRSQLPNPFDLDRSSLDEAELITKQKIVLQLRYLNARILLHRTFLISASVESHKEQYAAHTTACVEAASATIRFVHATYLHRPYFRTWWYNCTYVLDATMVLLYVILSNINPLTAAGLIEDIEKKTRKAWRK
ncbi:hypothetical protein SBRCBS47491_004485 [Sporothrix bragantina]|uniref:Uncharacterized protein n=1 Tax=Sporothrix bragantina TaxID=671064 RepID=A0ABP0BNX4_9PEZI